LWLPNLSNLHSEYKAILDSGIFVYNSYFFY